MFFTIISASRKVDKALEQLLIDMDCLNMYETFVDNKIQSNQVFKLDVEDLRTLGQPLGDVKRFVQAIPGSKKQQDLKVKTAGKFLRNDLI